MAAGRARPRLGARGRRAHRRAPRAIAGLERLPDLRVGTERELFRIHGVEHGPWWFASDMRGRFNLAAPMGTCALAEDPLGAFVETLGRLAVISAERLAQARLSRVRLRRSVRLADLTRRRIRAFDLTASVGAGEDYAATQRLASEVAAAGFEGVRYGLRHDPAQRLTGVALFGSAGEPPWPVIETLPIPADLIAAAERRFGLRVLPAHP